MDSSHSMASQCAKLKILAIKKWEESIYVEKLSVLPLDRSYRKTIENWVPRKTVANGQMVRCMERRMQNIDGRISSTMQHNQMTVQLVS